MKEYYNNKVVIVTGHTGFKGSWLTAWLRLMGAKVVGIALEPPTEPSHFMVANMKEGMKDLRIDLRDQKSVESAIVSAKPDFLFHLGAQALVRQSYADPLETWQTNVSGNKS